MSLPHAVLGMLRYRPMTGYDLKLFFDKAMESVWPAQISQIYRELSLMEAKGWIGSHIEPQETRPDRKVYSITDDGEVTFKEWLEKFPRSLSVTTRDDFSLRMFFSSGLSPEELKFQLKRFIREKQDEISDQQAVERYLEKMSEEMGHPEDEFHWRMTLRRSSILAEALILWAEDCYEELVEKYPS